MSTLRKDEKDKLSLPPRLRVVYCSFVTKDQDSEKPVRVVCSVLENFNHFILSCFNYVTRISPASLIHTARKSLENQRSNTNSIVTKTSGTVSGVGSPKETGNASIL